MITHQYSSKSGGILGVTGMYKSCVLRLPRCGSLLIGRDVSSCDIVISKDCEKISRTHCQVEYDMVNGYYNIKDMSKNGMIIQYRNEKEFINNQSARAFSGSMICLGDSRNSFKLL